jgi:hypothetical protein
MPVLPHKWRPRFSIRAVMITVTLICAYFAAWDATKKYGIEYPKFEFGPVVSAGTEKQPHRAE